MLARRIVHGNRRVLRALAPFNGNFASLFPGAYQVLQSDLGLTYGGTMLDVGGIGPVLTLTGTLTGAPVPIWVVCTFAGVRGVWTFNVYYDGAGVTPEMSGVVSGGLPIRLTGAGDGLFLNIAAGAAVLNNIWKATASALADQSGNGKTAFQATASAQPVITSGINGKPGLLFDGVDDYLITSAFAPPAGSMLYLVFRHMVSAAFKYITDSTGGNRYAVFQNGGGGGDTAIHNGATLSGGVIAVGSFGRLAGTYNGASSSVKSGSNAIVNGNAGANAAGADRYIGAVGNLGTFTNCEILALVWAPPGPTNAADTALNSSGGYGPGSILV